MKRQQTIYTFSEARVAIGNAYAGLYEFIYSDNQTQFMNEEIWVAVQLQYSLVQTKDRDFLNRWAEFSESNHEEVISFYNNYYLNDACELEIWDYEKCS